MAEIYWQEQARAIETMTGMPMNVEKLKAIGERIYNLQRCYNNIHGISIDDDDLPWRFTKVPSPSGNATGSVCRIDLMLPEYYALRNWDQKTGMPNEEILKQLGLEEAGACVRDSVNSGEAQKIYQNLGWAPPVTNLPPIK